MAGLVFSASSGLIASSTSAKTYLQVKAPANQAVKLTRYGITGASAAGGTDATVQMKMTRSTANFGTAGSTVTPQKYDPGRAETVQTVVGINFSPEPTSPVNLQRTIRFNPQLGLLEPLNQPIIIPGGQAINFEITAGAGTPSVEIWVECEE